MIMQNRDCKEEKKALVLFGLVPYISCIQTRLAADGSLEHSVEAS